MAKDYSHSSDAELVSLSKQGKTDAWRTLMQRHTAKAFQISYGILGGKEDAEEVVQDSFIRIYSSLNTFRNDAAFSTWMYRIVVNQARNKYRWNQRRGFYKSQSVDQNSGMNQFNDHRPLPDRYVILSEEQRNIYQEMQKLPELSREVLILRSLQDLSYEQIAKLLDTNIGTVKSRISRARKQLRKRLYSQ